MGEQIIASAQFLDDICGLRGLRTHLFDRRSGHHGLSSDALIYCTVFTQRQPSKSRARSRPAQARRVPNGVVSGRHKRLPVPPPPPAPHPPPRPPPPPSWQRPPS